MSDTARHNMIEQQIRTWEVLDSQVLSLYADDTLRRENFVSEAALKKFAYADMSLPIGEGQTMLEPKLEARMLQTLAVKKHERVLHIGSGSGFFAALLGRLAAEVISIEKQPALAQAAQQRLAGVCDNVQVIAADGADAYAAAAPYDAIVFTAALGGVSDTIAAQTKDGGRILAVIGSAPAMTLSLLHVRRGKIGVQHSILETVIPPLECAQTADFSF